ncbi:MAG: M23 family metallopeptidase [Parabacteroides sp.]
MNDYKYCYPISHTNKKGLSAGWLLFILCFFAPKGWCQELRNPFDFPILLSGNFGELRSNHFHSGIDFKTQGVEGKAVHAVQEGYVSRISVSPWGYGNALYLTHPDGTTTVYGHLQRFIPAIASYVKEQQYAQESFRVDLSLSPDQFPVERGAVIAYSGNTGSSGGPHLHFEWRDSETDEPMDALEPYLDRIQDTRAPRAEAIRVYPLSGEGVVNGSGHAQNFAVKNGTQGTASLSGVIRAWGKIGLAIRANDYMDQTTNVYGVRNIRLSVDGVVVFESDLNRFAFDETRYLNSYTDYAEWINHRHFFVKSFVEPGNRLRFIESLNRGIITIDEPRRYEIAYTLTDLAGNPYRLRFTIQGEEQPIPERETEGEEFHWNSENRFGAKGIRLTVPKGALYNDLSFHYHAKSDSSALSDRHYLHDEPVAFHRPAHLSLRLVEDTLEEKSHYGIVRLRNGKPTWIGGQYRQGWIDTEIRESGCYQIAKDSEAPRITPLDMAQWKKKRMFRFRLTDNLSGVENYRGEIDGAFVLFEMDNRSVITYRWDAERLESGPHTLKLTVWDAVKNEQCYVYEF